MNFKIVDKESISTPTSKWDSLWKSIEALQDGKALCISLDEIGGTAEISKFRSAANYRSKYHGVPYRVASRTINGSIYLFKVPR